VTRAGPAGILARLPGKHRRQAQQKNAAPTADTCPCVGFPKPGRLGSADPTLIDRVAFARAVR